MHSNPSPFLRSISQHMIVRRYSKRTIKTYIGWIKYFITYHEKRHPSELDSSHVEQFLTFLAIDRKVATATQKIVLNALAFLYNKFLDQLLNNMGAFRRACTQQKMPVVLTLLKWLNSYQVCRAQLCYSHHFLESGADIRTVEEQLGYQDVKTTEIYTHILNRGSKGVRSPFSDLQTIKEAAEK